MKNNKTLRVATSLMLVASTTAVAAAPVQTSAATKKPVLKSKFTDVKKGDYFHDAVVTLTDEQVLNGYGDQTFRPNVPTTRGHIAIVLTRVLNLQATQYVNIKDMPTTHDTYEYAAAAIIHGLMETDQYNNFNPKSELSRYEYAEILTRAYNLKPTYKKTHKFKNVPEQYKVAVQTVFDHGLMQGVATTDFGGYQNITRGQMAVTLINARSLNKEANPSEPAFKGQQETEILSYNTKTNKIVTTDGEFKISKKLQPLFTNSNKTILQNAIINGEFAGNELVAIQDLEIVQSYFATNGTFASLKLNAVAASNVVPYANIAATTKYAELNLGGVSIDGKIVVKRDNVAILNGSAGEIIITDEADRAFYLTDVKVKSLIVEYGYYRDFILNLKNTTPTNIQLDRDDVHLISNKKLPQVFLGENTYSTQLQTAIGQLQVTKDGYVTLKGQISIERLLVAGEAYVLIDSPGNVKEAEILDVDGQISLSNNVRIGTVTVPPVGQYNDYLSYGGNIKNVISKVKHPGSNQNLFHDLIQLPSKEEMQRQELFENLMNKFEATASSNQLTFAIGVNSYVTSMREYPVRLSFALTSSLSYLPSNQVIPTTITFKGISTKHNYTVAELRQGVIAVNEATLKDLAPNGENRVHVEFETPLPMTIRGNLVINGYSKGSAEAEINNQYEEKVKSLIQSFTASPTASGIEIKQQYGSVLQQFEQAPNDVRLQLTKLRKPTSHAAIIPFDLNYTFDGNEKTKLISNVTLDQLRNGLSLYSLLDETERKILSTHANKLESWKVEFKDSIDADFKATSLVNSFEVTNSYASVNYEASAIKAIDEVSTTLNNNVIQLTKTYKQLDNSLLNKPHDFKMKLISATVPATETMRVPFKIRYKLANGQVETKEITNLTVADLKTGVSLYALVNKNTQNLQASLSGKVETIDLEFHESLSGQLRFETTVDNVIETTNVLSINSNVAAKPSIAKLELIELNRGLRISKTFSTIQSMAEGRKQDLKLKVLSATQPTANSTNVEFKIRYRYDNGTEMTQIFRDKSLDELKSGVSIYSLLGMSNPKIETAQSGKIEMFDIEFLSEFDGKVQVTSDVESEQSIQKSMDASYTGVAFEEIKFSELSKGFIFTQQFGKPISAKYLNQATDAILKFQSNMPNSEKVTFTIRYKGLAGNVTSYNVTNQTVASLKEGVSLYALTGKTGPTLNRTREGAIEEFTIEFNENVIGQVNVQSIVDSGTQLKVVGETGFKDVYVANAASTKFDAKFENNQLIFKRNFIDFKDVLVGSSIDVKLFGSNIKNLTANDTVDLAVQRNNESEKIIRNVKVSELIAGKSLYSLIGMTQPKLAAKDKKAEETWKVRFLEEMDGQFTLSAYQGGKLINSSTSTNYKLAANDVFGINSFNVTYDSNQLKMTTKYDKAFSDQIIQQYPVDMLLKVTSGVANMPDNRLLSFNIKQGTTVYTNPFRVSVKELKAGVKLSEILGRQSLAQLGSLANKTDEWAISFNESELEPINLKMDVALLVNGKTTHNQINKSFDNRAQTLNGFVDQFNITSTTTTNEYAVSLKLKNRSNIVQTYGQLPVDLKLKISAATLPSEVYVVTITASPQQGKRYEVSAVDLKQGIMLNELTGQSPIEFGKYNSSSDWTIKVEAVDPADEHKVSVGMDLLIGDYIVRNAKLNELIIPSNKATEENKK